MTVSVEPAQAPFAARFGRVLSIDKSLWFPIGVACALFVFFSLATESFATARNFTVVSGQAATLLIPCVGTTFIILMGSIDLSVGAIVLLVGAAGVQIMNYWGIGGASILVVAALLGGALGMINGLIYAIGRVPSFVVTLGSLSVFSGLALQILDGRAIQYSSSGFDNLAIGQMIPSVPNIALCALAVWGVTVLIASRTRFGRYMYLIGGGEAVARTAGVPVRSYKIYAFALSGGIAGIGAMLAIARLGAAGPSLGSELLLNSLAAIVVGGTSLAGGVGGPHRTLIGVIIVAMLDDGLNLMDVSQYLQMIVKGIVVIAAVLVSRHTTRGLVVK